MNDDPLQEIDGIANTAHTLAQAMKWAGAIIMAGGIAYGFIA